MIGHRYATDQVARLMGLQFFPCERPAQNELVKMLTFAKTEVIARTAVDAWIENEAKAPSPHDLRELVANLNVAQEAREAQTHVVAGPILCGRCRDCGFYGGLLTGKEAGRWLWCDCPAAERRYQRQPGLVDDANWVREDLLRIFKVRPEMAQAVAVADGYHGEF